MLPSVKSFADDIAKIIESPKREAVIAAASGAAGFASDSALDAVKSDSSIEKKISDFKSRNIINSDDVAYACALADILYDNILLMKINNVPLNKLKYDSDSVPAAFIFFGQPAVDAAATDLKSQCERIRRARIAFDTAFPACICAIFAKEYMDLKALATKLSSMAIADVWLVKDALRNCQNGVEICDKGLSWASQYQKTLASWSTKTKH